MATETKSPRTMSMGNKTFLKERAELASVVAARAAHYREKLAALDPTSPECAPLAEFVEELEVQTRRLLRGNHNGPPPFTPAGSDPLERAGWDPHFDVYSHLAVRLLRIPRASLTRQMRTAFKMMLRPMIFELELVSDVAYFVATFDGKPETAGTITEHLHKYVARVRQEFTDPEEGATDAESPRTATENPYKLLRKDVILFGDDPHRDLAAAVFHKPVSEVTSMEREFAKSANQVFAARRTAPASESPAVSPKVAQDPTAELLRHLGRLNDCVEPLQAWARKIHEELATKGGAK
jgi:hypothetical protein